MEPKDPEDPEDPEFLARQPMLVFDGASASAGACIETLDGRTTATVTTLLDATGVPWRKGRPPKQPPLLRR